MDELQYLAHGFAAVTTWQNTGLMLTGILLGIVTVVYAAPWHAAILHQLVAVGLWVSVLRARYLAAYPISTSIKDH